MNNYLIMKTNGEVRVHDAHTNAYLKKAGESYNFKPMTLPQGNNLLFLEQST